MTSTVCDIEDSWSTAEAVEAAGADFAKLLQGLALEHGRIRQENSKLLAQIEHGRGSIIQDSECQDSANSVFPDDVHLEEATDWEQSQGRISPSISPKSRRSTTPKVQGTKMHNLWVHSAESLTEIQIGVSTRQKTLKLDESYVRGGDSMEEKSLKQRFIVKPNSLKRMFWDLLSIIVLSIDILMVPMIAFDIEETTALKVTSLFCASFWTLDIVASFLTGFHKEGTIEMRPRQVFLNYWRSWLLFDVMIVLMDWALFLLTSDLVQVAGIFRASKLLRLGRIIRAFRLLRLLRLLKMPSLLDDLADYMGAEGLVIGFRVLRALGTIAVANHFLACGWYAVGKASSPSWITELDNDQRDLAFRYTSALHWSLTQFTPASMEIYPRGLPERVYSICVLFLALVVFSSFVSSITNAMNHLRQINESRTRQRDNLRRYIHENKLSLELTNRITAFVKHLNVRTRDRVHEHDIEAFKVLPESLRLQLHWEVYVPILSVHPFFFSCAEYYEPFVLKICANALIEESLITGQELFSQDEEAKRMYFAISGALEYFQGNTDIQMEIVAETEWCCEVALWLTWIHTGQLVALSHAELVALDASSFRKIVSRSTGMFEVCKRYASAFRERAANLSADTPLDIFCDQGSALETSHYAFEADEQEYSSYGTASKSAWRDATITLRSMLSKLSLASEPPSKAFR